MAHISIGGWRLGRGKNRKSRREIGCIQCFIHVAPFKLTFLWAYAKLINAKLQSLWYKDVYIVPSLSLILTLLFSMPESQCSMMLVEFLILQKLFWIFYFFLIQWKWALLLVLSLEKFLTFVDQTITGFLSLWWRVFKGKWQMCVWDKQTEKQHHWQKHKNAGGATVPVFGHVDNRPAPVIRVV